MKVFVVGAGGRVGRVLTRVLDQAGYSVYAASREPEDIHESDNVKAVFFDLHHSTEVITRALRDMDSVVFVAGSGGHELLQTDLYGAIKVMKAAEQNNIKRYVQLSTAFALEPADWEKFLPENMINYYIAKYLSDAWLVNNTSLHYTIVQPTQLTDEPGSGRVSFGVTEPGHGTNSIENVARVLACVLEQPQSYGKVIVMKDGETPIADAIGAL